MMLETAYRFSAPNRTRRWKVEKGAGFDHGHRLIWIRIRTSPAWE
jgi:hypothetical protein